MDKKYEDRWKVCKALAKVEAYERKASGTRLLRVPLLILTLLKTIFVKICEIDDRLSELESKKEKTNE